MAEEVKPKRPGGRTGGKKEVKNIAHGIACIQATFNKDRKSTRLNSSHIQKSRMPSSA